MEWKVVGAAAAWTATIALAIARATTGMSGMAVWAILLGQVAMVFTGWLIVEDLMDRCRRRLIDEQRQMYDAAVERVAVRLAEALREGGVSSLR